MLDRESDQLGEVFETELVQDVLPVGMYGLGADVKQFGDLPGRLAFSQEVKYFLFPRCKHVQFWRGLFVGILGENPGQVRRENGATFVDRANRSKQFRVE